MPTNAFTLHCSFMSQYHRVLPWIVNKNIDKIRNMFSRLQFVPDIKRNWSYIAKRASCELIIEIVCRTHQISIKVFCFSPRVYIVLYMWNIVYFCTFKVYDIIFLSKMIYFKYNNWKWIYFTYFSDDIGLDADIEPFNSNFVSCQSEQFTFWNQLDVQP